MGAAAVSVAERLQLPEKKYFKIGEVASLLDVKPHVLRYWETEFPQVRPQKSRSGQRMYRHKDVETLATIRELLYVQKFTIPGARQALRGLTSSTIGKAKKAAAQPSLLPEAVASVDVVPVVHGDVSGARETEFGEALALTAETIEVGVVAVPDAPVAAFAQQAPVSNVVIEDAIAELESVLRLVDDAEARAQARKLSS